MSKKDTVTEQNAEKKMTKYDQKMQKRKEAEAKAKKQQKKERLIWVVVILALVALIASFPIRSYIAKNEVIATINGEPVKRVEFDYHYNVARINYVNELSSLGVDMSGDYESQMYSDILTFRDQFEKEAINGIISARAMRKEAEAAGFVYDGSKELQEYKDSFKQYAQESGLTMKKYIQGVYGLCATPNEIYDLISNSIYVTAYLNQVRDEKMPSDDEVQAYYDERKINYDSVDYYVVTVKADLPTDSETEPTEEEIAEAMAQAKIIADTELETVSEVGELMEGIRYSEVFSMYGDWLFDEFRKEGDTTVIEDTSNNSYHVIYFVKRYLDETPTADARVIINAEGQSILDEWKNGEATEESFAALADKYNNPATLSAEGGLCQAISPSGSEADLAAWLFDENRVAGDTSVIEATDGTYIMYFVGNNEPEWKLSIKNTLLEEILNKNINFEFEF